MKKVIAVLMAVAVLAAFCGCELSNLIGNAEPVATRDPAVIEKEGPNADDVLAALHLLAQDVYRKREAYFAKHGSSSPAMTEKELNGVRFVKISTPFADCNDIYTGEPVKEYAPYFMECNMIHKESIWDERQMIYDLKDVVCLSARISDNSFLKPLYITFDFYLPYDMASELLTLLGSTEWKLTQEDIDFEKSYLHVFAHGTFEGMTGFTLLDIDETFIRSLPAEKIKYFYEFIPTLRYYIFEAGADDYEDFYGGEVGEIIVKEYTPD